MKNKIGNLKLKNKFFLSPMLEPNDIAFRLLCKKCGCALNYTGMVSPLSKQKIHLDDKPAIQIFANSSLGIKEFIKKYDKNVSLWDFNLGCPSKLSRKLGHGAFLQKDKKKIIEIINEIKSSTKKPITIKLRKSPQTIEISKLLEGKVDAIGIHPRTIEQGYSGKADYEFALELKKSTNLPIIYSGDVNEKNIEKISKDFDFVFIGREAIGNPNIFSKITKNKNQVNFEDYLKLAKKYKLFFRQVKYQAMNFTKGKKNAKRKREKLVQTKAIEDIENIFENKQINK